MGLEIITVCEVSQTGKGNQHMLSLMWNLKKNDTNEFICKIETDSQTLKIISWLPKGKDGWKVKLGVWDKDTRTSICQVDKQQGLIIYQRELYSITVRI